MTIHLPEDLERFVQLKVQSGRFASEDEVIGEAVRLLRQQEEAQQPERGEPPVNCAPTIAPSWQRILDIMSELPDDAFDRMPSDSSEHLDHYLYGTPKRANS